MPAIATARSRARAEITAAIKDAARRQVAAQGAASLSLRSIARELEMASSAIYRYFPSRDELLTALIVDAYNALGEAAETAEASVDRADLMGRWLAAARALRAWAIGHPHEYALVYGSPVPGYNAPQDTVAPATRVSFLLASILTDAAALGRLQTFRDDVDPTMLTSNLDQVIFPELAISADSVARGITAWVTIFGLLNFELFGHLVGSVEDFEAFFDHAVSTLGPYIGIDAQPT